LIFHLAGWTKNGGENTLWSQNGHKGFTPKLCGSKQHFPERFCHLHQLFHQGVLWSVHQLLERDVQFLASLTAVSVVICKGLIRKHLLCIS
jgi:hypothetical protein